MKKFFVVLIAAFFTGILGFTSNPGDHNYIGNKLCMACHKPAAKVWKTTKHATAYETLKSEESKKIAKKMGIEDPTKAEKCLKCHVTNSGKGKGVKLAEGVSCESCHGPGSDYKSKKVMEDPELAKKNGLIVGANEPELCKRCHNEESPTYKPFDYKKDWKAIAHPEKK